MTCGAGGTRSGTPASTGSATTSSQPTSPSVRARRKGRPADAGRSPHGGRNPAVLGLEQERKLWIWTPRGNWGRRDSGRGRSGARRSQSPCRSTRDRCGRCALLEGGGVKCWGDNSRWTLGYPDYEDPDSLIPLDIGDDETPADMPTIQLGGKAVLVSAGSCAILESGGLRCWGESLSGSLGIPGEGTIGDNEHPAEAPLVELGGAVESVTVAESPCALLQNGDVRCWGREGLLVGARVSLRRHRRRRASKHCSPRGDLAMKRTLASLALLLTACPTPSGSFRR